MKNKQLLLILFLLSILSTGCKQKGTQQEKVLQMDTVISEFDERRSVEMQRHDSLVARLTNRVSLDTLLRQITNQQNVKILAELCEEDKIVAYSNPEAFVTTYSGGGYSFKIKTKGLSMSFPDNENDENTILYDGKKKIVFRNYKVTCYNNKDYHCDDFGFKAYHCLVNPKIIEVCGKKFLYSELGFACNGIGCGQKLTMIYDLAKKKPTFVGNFNLDFDGFLLSDFDNDGTPELLITAKTSTPTIDDNCEELDMMLLAYKYDNGIFQPTNTFIHLHGIGNEFGIMQDKWFESEIRNKFNKTNMKTEIPSLCVLEKTDEETTFLINIVKYEQEIHGKPLVSGSFFLSFKLIKANGSAETHTSCTACFTPQKDNRYRIEIRREAISFYKDGVEQRLNASPSFQWEFVGYSNEQTIYAKILKYYLNHKSEIKVWKGDE